MKIVQIMPEFGLAGAEIMCENLSYELMKMGHDVVIISLYDYHSAITERIEKAGIKIIYLEKKKGFDFNVFLNIRKTLKEEKPDLIHTHRYVLIYAVLASSFLGIKRVHTVHNIANKEVGTVYRFFNSFFYHTKCVTPVALSVLIRDTIKSCYRLKEDKIPIVYNGINLSKCIRKTNYQTNKKVIILNIARFNKQKNHKRLIDAFNDYLQINKNAELWLVGTGDLNDEIRQLVSDYSILDKVKFCGLQNSVYETLNEADLFVLSSDYEGMPMTLIEAMGTGLPVISTNVGAIPEMIKDGVNGILTDKDAKSICSAIDCLVRDEGLRKKLGEKAVKESDRFSSYQMAREYVRIYKVVTNGRIS